MNDDMCMAQEAPDNSTLYQRFLRWAIPCKFARLPERESLGFEPQDVIHLDTATTFSFWDRLKIFIFGTVATSVRIVTEHKPGQHHTALETYISTESRESQWIK